MPSGIDPLHQNPELVGGAHCRGQEECDREQGAGGRRAGGLCGFLQLHERGVSRRFDGLARLPCHLGGGVDNDALHSNAANIAAFLLRLSNRYPEHYEQILETVRQVAPFFGTFVLKEVGSGQT